MTAVHAREFDRVSNEEDRQVVEDKVVITIPVKNLVDHPLMSLTVSLEPFSPPSVKMRVRMGVFLPTSDRNFATVKSETSSSTSKVPRAPAALACTLLLLQVSNCM